MKRSGCGAAWLARLLGVQEVPGSNPGSPTIRFNLQAAFFRLGHVENLLGVGPERDVAGKLPPRRNPPARSGTSHFALTEFV